MKLDHTLVVLDLETTGTWVEKDRIVEVGIIKLSPEGRKDIYHKRVNPGMPIPANVSLIIGIHDEDVKDAPAFKDIAGEVLEFIGDSDLAGFNIERFDLPILEREMRGAGMTFIWRDRAIYDAQKIYHIHEKRNLAAAYKLYCGKELHGAHTALADAKATAEILEAQIGRYGSDKDGIASLKDIEYERSSNYFDKERKFSWWNGELYPTFGKYARKVHLREIRAKNPQYLDWILSKDFAPEIKDMIKTVRGGGHPASPAQIKRGCGEPG